MALAPSTLFPTRSDRAPSRVGVRANVVGVLSLVLSDKPLISLDKSAKQHLQHLQRMISRVCVRSRIGAGDVCARGGVAGVVTVVNDNISYKSISYITTPSTTLRAGQNGGCCIRRDLASHAALADAEAIKYCLIFKGLALEGVGSPRSAGNGAFGVRAFALAADGAADARLAARSGRVSTWHRGSRRPRGRNEQYQGLSSPRLGWSQSQARTASRIAEPYQGLATGLALVVGTIRGAGSAPATGGRGTVRARYAPPFPPEGTPPNAPAPFPSRGVCGRAAPLCPDRAGEKIRPAQNGSKGRGVQGRAHAMTLKTDITGPGLAALKIAIPPKAGSWGAGYAHG